MKQILFDSFEIQKQFRNLHPQALVVIDFMSENAWMLWQELLYCTSIMRTKKLSARDTHYRQPKPYRFIDFGCLVRGNSERLRQMTNQEFIYDPQRPALLTIPPLDHGTAPHFHLQVRA
jgi:hypothetical protein